MKTNINVEKEIVVKISDERGVTSRVAGVLAEAGVNIKAICGYAVDNDAHLRLVTDNNQKAMESLKRAGMKAEQYDVVRCEVSPNVVHPDLGVALAGYEVGNNYWCAAAHGGEHAVLYFPLKGNVQPSASNM
ncbi:MAG: hypothetical protein ABH871_04185 [Pseudomonadota bacterium]